MLLVAGWKQRAVYAIAEVEMGLLVRVLARDKDLRVGGLVVEALHLGPRKAIDRECNGAGVSCARRQIGDGRLREDEALAGLGGVAAADDFFVDGLAGGNRKQVVVDRDRRCERVGRGDRVVVGGQLICEAAIGRDCRRRPCTPLPAVSAKQDGP